MIWFVSENLADIIPDLRRWVISGAVVAFAHGSIAAAIVAWRDPPEPAESSGAIVIEFAPVPVSPAAEETDLQPGPEQVMSDASPKVEQKVEAKPVEEPPPEVSPAPNPDVTVQARLPEVREETPQRQEPRDPVLATTAPQASPVERAAIDAAPAQGQPKLDNSKAVPIWRNKVFAVLSRTIRYPVAAERRSQTGVAQVFFSLDRHGRVIDSRLVRSSGVPALDEEALAVLRRAQPFPAPPPELPGEQVGLTAPIRFNLK